MGDYSVADLEQKRDMGGTIGGFRIFGGNKTTAWRLMFGEQYRRERDICLPNF